MSLTRAFCRTWFILVIVFVSGVSQAEALKCTHLPQLFELFVKSHYSYEALNDQLKKQTIDQYVKRVDSSKTLLLKSDVEEIKKKSRSLFKTMNVGNCDQLDWVGKLMVTRAKENEDFVRKFLGADYKLDEKTELILDPRKREYPANIAARNEVLKKIVHFQVSNYLMTDMKLDEAKKQLIHRYELVTKRMTEKTPADLVEEFAEAFAIALDPHSSFLSRDNVEDFQIQMQLSLEGIGASLSSQNGFTVIESLIKGGGAEKSKKLEPKDKIISVAQGEDGKAESIIDMDLKDVVKLIRGKKGTKVKLTILRQAETNETFEVVIVRDKIDIEEQAAKIFYSDITREGKKYKVGIIDLPSFYGGGKGGRLASKDVRRLLREAKKEKVDGIVLDVSRNGGGLLEEAVRISGLFINKGGVVATKSSNGKVEVLDDEDQGMEYDGPLVLLTSRLSASASEILAGALKDYKRAVIVGGENTFGKGSVQTFLGLPLGLGAMKVTTGMFFLPGGQSTQRVGVESDVKLPSVFETDDIGESALDYALGVQTIGRFVSSEGNIKGDKGWKPIGSNIIKKLNQLSQKRVAKDALFDDIRKRIKERKKNEEKVLLADLRKKSKEENGDKKDEKDKKEDKEDDDKKYLESAWIQEGSNVLIDLVQQISNVKS